MHHANLYIGKKEWALALMRQSGPAPAVVDTMMCTYERMSIADVRQLIAQAQYRPVESAYRVFVVSCASILPEAQNALLKLVEEPHPGVMFHFIIPDERMLLPTLRSRLMLCAKEVVLGDEKLATMLVARTPADRLSWVTEQLKSESSDWIHEVVRALAKYARDTRNVTLLETCLFVESSLRYAGASKKMLMEHLMLSL